MKHLFVITFLLLSPFVSANQQNDRCINDFMELLAIVDDVGKGELRKPLTCKTPEVIVYNRFVDGAESVVIGAMLNLRDGPGSQFTCLASLFYFQEANGSGAFLWDYPTEKHHYTYSDVDLIETVISQRDDLCATASESPNQ